jgi:hypothetical protein
MSYFKLFIVPVGRRRRLWLEIRDSGISAVMERRRGY